MYKKLFLSFSITSLLLISNTSLIDTKVNTVNAEELKADEAKVKIVKINEGQFKIVPNKYAEGKVENGKATIINKINGSSEELPTEVLTKNNKKANITYKVLNKNIIGEVKLAESEDIVFYKSKTNWKKCALGTGGVALGGAGGGLATGAGYGAIGATPVTVLGGSVFGAIIGGVSSGMVGAAASCFK